MISVTDDTFDAQINKADVPVLIYFRSEWCGECHKMAPNLEQLATTYATRLKMVQVDVDSNHQTAYNCAVQNVPTIVLCKNGQEVERVQGLASQDQLVARIQPFLD